MHDGLQYATLVILLFGILLNRYDVAALRKEMRENMAAFRADVHRGTTMLTELLFRHAKRLI